jgi:hypothetical protein
MTTPNTPSSAATPRSPWAERPPASSSTVRLPHEPLHRRAALVRVATAARPASWSARSKTKSASSIWPSARPRLACAPCARPRAADSPSCPKPRPLRHGRNSHRRHQLHARGPVHRRPHQNRTGRPVADARARPSATIPASSRRRSTSATASRLMPEIFNITDKFQVPGLVLCDLLLSEGRLSVDPESPRTSLRPSIAAR